MLASWRSCQSGKRVGVLLRVRIDSCSNADSRAPDTFCSNSEMINAQPSLQDLRGGGRMVADVSAISSLRFSTTRIDFGICLVLGWQEGPRVRRGRDVA